MNNLLAEAESIVGLPQMRWTLERYHAAIKAGVLTENDKVELLFGKLVQMSPVGVHHAKIVNCINQTLIRSLPVDEYMVGVQNPISLNDNSEPEPDIYVARGSIGSYDDHPVAEELVLVIEVSDTTLRHDRTAKKYAYAFAGIVEYWIVNAYEREIEVFTEPDTELGGYNVRKVYRKGDTIATLHLGEFGVADLFPPHTNE